MAAGHALDNISDWLEKSAPQPSLDKPKLERAASLTPITVSKTERKVCLLCPFVYLAKTRTVF